MSCPTAIFQHPTLTELNIVGMFSRIPPDSLWCCGEEAGEAIEELEFIFGLKINQGLVLQCIGGMDPVPFISIFS